MTGLWGTLLDIALKLVGMFLDKSAQSAEAKKSFLKFIGELEEKQIVSSKLRLSYAEQLKKLKEDETK